MFLSCEEIYENDNNSSNICTLTTLVLDCLCFCPPEAGFPHRKSSSNNNSKQNVWFGDLRFAGWPSNGPSDRVGRLQWVGLPQVAKSAPQVAEPRGRSMGQVAESSGRKPEHPWSPWPLVLCAADFLCPPWSPVVPLAFAPACGRFLVPAVGLVCGRFLMPAAVPLWSAFGLYVADFLCPDRIPICELGVNASSS